MANSMPAHVCANPSTLYRVLFLTADGSVWPSELYPTRAIADSVVAGLLTDPNVKDAKVVEFDPPALITGSGRHHDAFGEHYQPSEAEAWEYPDEPPTLAEVEYYDPRDDDIAG